MQGSVFLSPLSPNQCMCSQSIHLLSSNPHRCQCCLSSPYNVMSIPEYCSVLRTTSINNVKVGDGVQKIDIPGLCPGCLSMSCHSCSRRHSVASLFHFLSPPPAPLLKSLILCVSACGRGGSKRFGCLSVCACESERRRANGWRRNQGEIREGSCVWWGCTERLWVGCFSQKQSLKRICKRSSWKIIIGVVTPSQGHAAQRWLHCSRWRSNLLSETVKLSTLS